MSGARGEAGGKREKEEAEGIGWKQREKRGMAVNCGTGGGEQSRMRGGVREGGAGNSGTRERGGERLWYERRRRWIEKNYRRGGRREGGGALSYKRRGIEREKRKVERISCFIPQYVTN